MASDEWVEAGFERVMNGFDLVFGFGHSMRESSKNQKIGPKCSIENAPGGGLMILASGTE